MFYRKYNECCFEGKITDNPRYENDILYFTLCVPKNDDTGIKIYVPIYAYKTLAAVLHAKLSVGDHVYVETMYHPYREDNKVHIKFNACRFFQITQNEKVLRYVQDK